jgi:cytochrome c-type biogenesis protein CcmH
MPDKRRLAVFLILTVLFTTLLFQTSFSSAAFAQTPAVTDDEVNAVAKDLYCPVCESTPLDVCSTQACADWREVIREKLGEGQTSEEIKDYFALQYGQRVLAEPSREGFSLAVWIMPIAAVVLGGFLFTRYVRGIRLNTEHDMTSGPELANIDASAGVSESEDYEAQIEKELREKYS